MANTDYLRELSDILAGGGAVPVVTASRIAPSTIYDAEYRVAIIACAFYVHARPNTLGHLSTHAAHLKLTQFIAMRPWLLPTLRAWSTERHERQASLLAPRGVRHGFLGDSTYDDAIAFLTSSDVLTRVGTQLVVGPRAALLHQTYAGVRAQNLFASERQVIDQLLGIKVTNHMLEGW